MTLSQVTTAVVTSYTVTSYPVTYLRRQRSLLRGARRGGARHCEVRHREARHCSSPRSSRSILGEAFPLQELGERVLRLRAAQHVCRVVLLRLELLFQVLRHLLDHQALDPHDRP